MGVGLWVLMAVRLVPPVVPSGSAPAGARLETEYKLAVPAGHDNAVWHWLRATYATAKPRALGTGWASAMGEETFRDRYFDVPAGTLLKVGAGLRHRQRFDTTGHLTKQLVQLKITTAETGGMLREERKFKPLEGATADMALAEVLRPEDRPRLDTLLAPLGVALAEVQPAFGLNQRRRRLYLRQNDEDFSTITLDSSYHAEGSGATFTEIEIELNEKRYTGASETERARMRVVLDGIKADLLLQFPDLQQDQRPKYAKMAALLAPKTTGAARDSAGARSPQQQTQTHTETPTSAPRPWFWVLGGLVGVGLGYWVLRAQRKV